MKCPKCHQPMPSAAPACSNCGYDFPEPETLDLATFPNLILLGGTLVSLGAAGYAALNLVMLLLRSNAGGRNWDTLFITHLAATVFTLAAAVAFMRSLR